MTASFGVYNSSRGTRHANGPDVYAAVVQTALPRSFSGKPFEADLLSSTRARLQSGALVSGISLRRNRKLAKR